MKHHGINAKKKTSYLQEIKAMAKLRGKDILQEVKLPIKRKSRPVGLKYNNPEAQLRKEIIKHLKKRGFRVYRIENSIGGRSTGISDLLVFRNELCFIELKSSTGKLQENQIEFMNLCNKTNTNHVVCRSIEDLKNII